jgi:hypothetical protein
MLQSPPGFGFFDIVEKMKQGIYRMLAEAEYFTSTTTYKDGPFLTTLGFPVGCYYRGCSKVPTIVHIVVNKILLGEKINIGITINIADITNQRAHYPGSLHIRQALPFLLP